MRYGWPEGVPNEAILSLQQPRRVRLRVSHLNSGTLHLQRLAGEVVIATVGGSYGMRCGSGVFWFSGQGVRNQLEKL